MDAYLFDDQRRYLVVEKHAGLNRAQRRSMKKAQRAPQYRDVPLPAAIDEFTVFDMPQTILDKISNGAIEAAAGVPIFRDSAGDWQEVCPALDGWIFTWREINTKLGTDVHLQPLERLHNKLLASMPISESDIDAAKATLRTMRQVFRTSDRKTIASIARTAQIKILMADTT